jgi:hypothetical protein
MLKGLVNLFKCKKPKNRSIKNQSETINYQETVKDSNEEVSKNIKKCLTDKSLTTKSTNLNNCPTINSDKEKSPEPVASKKAESPYNDFPFEAKNINNEKNYFFDPNKENINFDLNEDDVLENNNYNNDRKEKEKIEEKNTYIFSDKINEVNNHFDNFNKEDKLIETIKKNDCELNKVNQKETGIKTEDEFDKIIVPDEYIREDERNHLVWVKIYFSFCY